MRLSTVVGISWIVFSNFPLYAAPNYTVTNLGTLGGSSSAAYAINNAGQVAGQADTMSNRHAFLFDGTMHDLGVLAPGAPLSGAFGISQSGLITGTSFTGAGGEVHAILYDGTMHDLGSLTSTYHFSQGNGINDNGQVVGYSFVSGTIYHAFLYDGTMHDLGTLGGAKSIATGINDNGLVVGTAAVNGNINHAFLYDGAMHDLGTLTGSASGAAAINNLGQVTGSFTATDGSEHAFFYDGTMHDLGMFNGNATVGMSINASGQIAGVFFPPGGDASAELALLYTPGVGMVNLNTQIDLASGWVLQAARGINDAGQIVGYGKLNGANRAFLLTPVPEPSQSVLGIIGAICLCAWRHNRIGTKAARRIAG